MTAVAVREASLADAESIASLVTELGYSTRADEMAERLAGPLPDPSYAAFVAERDSVLTWLEAANSS